jgi:hypothetical protein
VRKCAREVNVLHDSLQVSATVGGSAGRAVVAS